MKVHELKTVQPFFNQVKNGTKRFELRKNDRDFMVNDILVLKEYNSLTKVFVGDHVAVRVIGILDQFVGLKDGYCILSISDPI
jgi:hypothetical protein